MPPLAYWVHNLSPFVPYLRFSENIGVRWYGLAYVLGFVGGVLLFQFYAKKGRSLLSAEKSWDLIVVLVVGVMLGGRLGSFLFYHPEELIHNPLSFFRVWEGGMASHGGFIGLAIAIAWYARSQKIPFLHLSDIVVSAGPLGLFFGRLANFINGELWGKIADVPWAVIFPLSKYPGTPIDQIQPRHPSQLYEAALEGAFLFAYVQHRFWRNKVVQETPGQLTGEFLIGYALVRIFCEQFREPDAELILGLSRGSFYSIFMIVAGIAFIVVSRQLAARKKPQPPSA
jgi:phosphatidylglycerol:prolipoprotein diacylglycerol transferase